MNVDIENGGNSPAISTRKRKVTDLSDIKEDGDGFGVHGEEAPKNPLRSDFGSSAGGSIDGEEAPETPASSFDLREAAAGGDGDADDCERSAIFEELLHDASEDRFLRGKRKINDLSDGKEDGDAFGVREEEAPETPASSFDLREAAAGGGGINSIDWEEASETPASSFDLREVAAGGGGINSIDWEEASETPASSFDLREAAAGGDGDADDCERSVIFEERLHDASENRFLGRCIGTTKMPLLDAL